MRNLFNMDNPLFRFLGKVADMMILNLLFLVTSIPIFTIGASQTALYYTALKMVDSEEGYISRNYFHSFKENFKQATVLWLLYLVLGIVLVADLFILRSAEGTFVRGMFIAVFALCIFYLIMLNYTFAVLSRFYNDNRNTLKNAFIMSVANLPYTVVILLLTIAPVVVTIINGYTIWYGLLVWIMAGFSVTAFAKCWFFDKIFKKYMPAQEEETADPDAWVLDEEDGTQPAGEADVLTQGIYPPPAAPAAANEDQVIRAGSVLTDLAEDDDTEQP